jgi:hypothetical protein
MEVSAKAGLANSIVARPIGAAHFAARYDSAPMAFPQADFFVDRIPASLPDATAAK